MNDKPLVITIDLDERCPRCNKPGTTNGGPCLACIEKALKAGELDHVLGPLQDQVRAALKRKDKPGPVEG